MSTVIPAHHLAATFAAIRAQKRFILISPSVEPMLVGFDGFHFTVPGIDDIVPDTHDGTIFHSYLAPDIGKYIPGTLCVWDIFMKDNLGESKVWDVTLALRHILGLREYKKGVYIYDGTFGKAGLGVALDNATSKEIYEVRDGGLQRHKEFKLSEALMIVHSHDSQNEARKKANMTELPPSDNVRTAMDIVSVLQGKRRQVLLASFDITPQTIPSGTLDRMAVENRVGIDTTTDANPNANKAGTSKPSSQKS